MIRIHTFIDCIVIPTEFPITATALGEKCITFTDYGTRFHDTGEVSGPSGVQENLQETALRAR